MLSKTPEWGKDIVVKEGTDKEDSPKDKKPEATPKGWRGVGEFQVSTMPEFCPWQGSTVFIALEAEPNVHIS